MLITPFAMSRTLKRLAQEKARIQLRLFASTAVDHWYSLDLLLLSSCYWWYIGYILFKTKILYITYIIYILYILYIIYILYMIYIIYILYIIHILCIIYCIYFIYFKYYIYLIFYIYIYIRSYCLILVVSSSRVLRGCPSRSSVSWLARDAA